MIMRFAGWVAAMLSIVMVGPAAAHPDVAITARVLFDVRDGALVAMGESWTFDRGHSARLLREFDADDNGMLSEDESANLARTTLDDLAGRNYLTLLKRGNVGFVLPPPVWSEAMLEDGAVTLSFVFAFEAPLDLTGERAVALQLRDLDYVAAFRLAGDRPVLIRGGQGCAFKIGNRREDAYFGRLIIPWEIGLSCE